MRDRTELNTILNKENDKHLSSFLQVKLFQHFDVNAEAFHSIVMAMERLSPSFRLTQNKCRKDIGKSLITSTMYLLITQFPTNVDIFSKFKLHDFVI
jgi:hypothetical protein